MPRPAPVGRGTFEAFFEAESRSQTRHEFVDGMLFALAGGTDYHNTISGNVYAAIKTTARANGCFAFMENMLVQTPDGPTYYPDVFVTCDEQNDGSRLKRLPCFVVEVLLESTADTDRGEKLHNYRKIPTLKAYILVSQTRRLVEIYRRLEDNTWRYETIEDEGLLDLPCIDSSLNLDEVYADVGS